MHTVPNRTRFTTRSASGPSQSQSQSAVTREEVSNLAGSVVAVEVADEPLAGLGGGEELLLGDLGVLAVPLRAPLGAALGGAAHLLDPALPQGLDVVRVEAVERGDLLVELVLHGLRGRQHLLLQDLADDFVHGGAVGGRGAGDRIGKRTPESECGGGGSPWT